MVAVAVLAVATAARHSFAVICAKCSFTSRVEAITIIIMTVKTYGCHMDPYPASLGRRT